MPLSNNCAFKGCGNSSRKSPDLSFHRFPSYHETRKRWLLIAGRPEWLDMETSKLANQRICSAHFAKSDFTNHDRKFGKRKLTWNASPSPAQPEAPPVSEITVKLEESAQQPIEECVEPLVEQLLDCVEETIIAVPCDSSQMDQAHSKQKRPGPVLTYREKQLLKKLTACRSKLKVSRQKIRRISRKSTKKMTIPELLEGAAHYIEGDRLMLLKMQLTHTKIMPWQQDEKEFSLELFKKSARAYIHLKKNRNIALPSVSIIRKWLSETNSKIGTTAKEETPGFGESSPGPLSPEALSLDPPSPGALSLDPPSPGALSLDPPSSEALSLEPPSPEAILPEA